MHNISLHEACIVLRRSDPPSHILRSNFGVRSTPQAHPASAFSFNPSAFPLLSQPSAHSSSQPLETSRIISGNMLYSTHPRHPRLRLHLSAKLTTSPALPLNTLNLHPKPPIIHVPSKTKTITKISQPPPAPPHLPHPQPPYQHSPHTDPLYQIILMIKEILQRCTASPPIYPS